MKCVKALWYHKSLKSKEVVKITKKNYRLNYQITAKEVRLIGEDGKQIGIININEALSRAKSEELDLVEIAANAKPPVAKIYDYKKFLYEQEKKDKEARKHIRESDLKEIQMGPYVSDHDLNTRLKRGEEFLSKGNKLKATVKFTGRQMAHPEFGHNLIKRIVDHFDQKIKIDREAKFAGRKLSIILTPKKHA